MKKAVFTIACLALMLISAFVIYKASQDTYMKERVYSCKVLSKIDNQYETHSKSGYHYSRDFILVLESEGKKFSLDVEPTTWAICKEGDTLLFTIAPYQLDYYGAMPVRWNLFAWLVPLVSVGLMLIIGIGMFAKDDQEFLTTGST